MCIWDNDTVGGNNPEVCHETYFIVKGLPTSKNLNDALPDNSHNYLSRDYFQFSKLWGENFKQQNH